MLEYKFINNSDYNLEERERLAGNWLIDEREPHVFLSTCNRMELYKGEGRVAEEAVRHLYRVAAGLESSLIGERAIEGQLKKAYMEAKGKYKLSPSLNRLFQTAMHTGKRVRNETGISSGAVSHSQVTVELLNKEVGDLEHKIIGIIGVNKLTEDILKFLVSKHTINVFLSSRKFEKAQAAAEQYHGTAVRLERKQDLLSCADILISATSAPHLIVHEDDVPKERELLMFDLAFPRDIEPSIGDRPNVKLYNLDTIEHFAQANLASRKQEIRKAEIIIDEEMEKFFRWQYYSLQHLNTLKTK